MTKKCNQRIMKENLLLLNNLLEQERENFINI